jgi:hypothetical protein
MKAWNPDIDGLESSDGNWTASDSAVSKRGKNKDSFGKKQYFFLFFVHPLQTGRFPAVWKHPKPLRNKGFTKPAGGRFKDFKWFRQSIKLRPQCFAETCFAETPDPPP